MFFCPVKHVLSPPAGNKATHHKQMINILICHIIIFCPATRSVVQQEEHIKLYPVTGDLHWSEERTSSSAQDLRSYSHPRALQPWKQRPQTRQKESLSLVLHLFKFTELTEILAHRCCQNFIKFHKKIEFSWNYGITGNKDFCSSLGWKCLACKCIVNRWKGQAFF
jgi:hypothetical protein